MCEINVKSIRVHDKKCIGCDKFEKDVMISFDGNEISSKHINRGSTIIEGNKVGITDIFLTQEQAESLLEELTKVVTIYNKEENGSK